MAVNLLEQSIADMLADAEIFGIHGVIPARLEPGFPGARVLLATGPNACGKSFACRFLSRAMDDIRKESEGVRESEFFHIGMRMRTSGTGLFGPKTFVYGNESDKSTGAVSLKAVEGVLRQSQVRERRHLIALDEPEIGLSDEYALALADKLLRFAADLPALCDGLVVVSHNRAFIGRLLDLNPHCLRFGPGTTREWLASPPRPATVEDLDALSEANSKTFAALARILGARREAARAPGPR